MLVRFDALKPSFIRGIQPPACALVESGEPLDRLRRQHVRCFF
jgi:hypothetical protein